MFSRDECNPAIGWWNCTCYHLRTGLDRDIQLVQHFQLSPLDNRWKCLFPLSIWVHTICAILPNKMLWEVSVDWALKLNMLLLKMDQTFIYPFNSVLTMLPWVRYGEVSHRSRERNQKEFYHFVTHSSLGRTQHDTQCHSGEAPALAMRQKERGELWIVSLLWFPWVSKFRISYFE